MSEEGQSGDGVERTRVGHCKRDSMDEYIGRGPDGRSILGTPPGNRGWLGNPYTVEEYGREASIEGFRKAFEHRLENDDEFRGRVQELAGKRLGCWCQDLDADAPACHGEVIAEHADRLARSKYSGTDRPEGGEVE